MNERLKDIYAMAKKSKLLIYGVMILVFLILFLVTMNLKIEYFIGLITVTITSIIGYHQNKIQNDVIFYKLFQYFTQSYNEKYNNFFNELRLSQIHKTVFNPPDFRNTVIDYINFCAEEYMWYSKNRIPKDVWINWKSGMYSNLNDVRVKEIYIDEMKNFSSSYYGLNNELKIN